MAKVKPWVKIVGIAVIAAGVGLGLNAAGVFEGSEKSSTSGNGGEKKESSGGLFGSKSKKIDYITVGTNTYAGFLPFMYLNNGLEPNEDCILYKEYGLYTNRRYILINIHLVLHKLYKCKQKVRLTKP